MVQRRNPEILKDPQYVVALLVAALVHDTDHLGVMNGFLQVHSPPPPFPVRRCASASADECARPRPRGRGANQVRNGDRCGAQATRHPLAVMYNNQSILENHHCATALSLLERPELNFLAALPVENQVTIKVQPVPPHICIPPAAAAAAVHASATLPTASRGALGSASSRFASSRPTSRRT